MKRPRPRAARALAAAFVLVTAALTAAGCGGAMSGAQTPATSPDIASSSLPPPATVDEALAQLDTAELDVNRSLGYPAGGDARPYAEPPGQSPQGEAAQPAPAPATAPPPSPARTSEYENEQKRETTPAPPPDPCTTACRALASMGRAADHLCGLAGAEDPRCGHARERLQLAENRVRQSCPNCVQ
jgi:hypothetical protein